MLPIGSREQTQLPLVLPSDRDVEYKVSSLRQNVKTGGTASAEIVHEIDAKCAMDDECNLARCSQTTPMLGIYGRVKVIFFLFVRDCMHQR